MSDISGLIEWLEKATKAYSGAPVATVCNQAKLALIDQQSQIGALQKEMATARKFETLRRKTELERENESLSIRLVSGRVVVNDLIQTMKTLSGYLTPEGMDDLRKAHDWLKDTRSIWNQLADGDIPSLVDGGQVTVGHETILEGVKPFGTLVDEFLKEELSPDEEGHTQSRINQENTGSRIDDET